ncbi:dTDP-4-dehydrorhamnose reductase [Granulibacter bethesdensis]|uniref:dTDP-4-dehydrorhamnose reductase n=2 Tax=Granulibacter bethesdensis TaxID=364410 RepID=Q0BVZ9_GRABC|nr:dTDP-4-dehydrorhamnose reductase [Granulibacter bethesdensis CGDNIH1]AHJ61849.1 dTDP-4-dehydrorhamnose reductase [Granulibacter bethesdensis]AHJ64472.1 dTDP-4-dehydrorhamnose reductase [Granulibacter bethesdensis CGDNIH4]AHJ67090.1 dTDP-4-dehydrorhamnose reductase [Granulibacter bethesdensis]APH50773.1 dTDP-4-dehydrorhamnose reductase [Granulibacter bethesdensis]
MSMSGPILVTGGSGQVALALEEAAKARGVSVRRVGRPEFDFDRPDSIETVFREVSPSLVVNAAAYTAVDAAESDVAAAERANRDGPARLAELCAVAGIPLIHISTDYVFDGSKGAPYVETDPTNPTGVYGRTKLAGEDAVLATCRQAIVLRTAWVVSHTGKNFVKTMLNAARKTDTLRVVADQQGNPTSAADLAEAILDIAKKLEKGWNDTYFGPTHAAGTGATTWHGLAEAVFEQAAKHGAPRPAVHPIKTSDWPTPARRPADSRLDCTRLETVFGVRMPDWQGSIALIVDQLSTEGAPG